MFNVHINDMIQCLVAPPLSFLYQVGHDLITFCEVPRAESSCLDLIFQDEWGRDVATENNDQEKEAWQ